MFKPLRLVYLEAAPEGKQETLTTKNFLNELRKFGYDQEKSKEALCKGALIHSGGYKLTKAEALFEGGKLRTITDLENAASESLNVGDIDDFLNKYGGDKYVKRLFVYGVGKMERDFMKKKQDFQADKKKGGEFEGLKQYATFEDAFNAGFYKEFAVDFDAIMEKGLSVSEYRQRDERFKKLEKRVKKMEEEALKGRDLPPLKVNQPKVEEKKVEVEKRQETLPPSSKEPVKGIEHTPPKQEGPSEREKQEMEKERKLNTMLMKLGDVTETYRQSDILIPTLVKKYKLDEISGELGITTLTETPENKEGYEEKFLKKVVVKNDVAQMGKGWLDFLGETQWLRKEIVEELTGGYNDLITERLEKLEKLETALYLRGDGSSDPRKVTDETIRAENVAAAENACPEIKDVQKLLGEMSKAASQWRLEVQKMKIE
jgi:hypothetical protein